jgi:predicted acylesterase/phospholipase RssA
MIGFCFTGEGARGSIQAGMALALHNQGIDADFVIGISSGSCCSVGYSFGGPEGLSNLWSNINTLFSVFSINWNCAWKRGLLNQKPAEKIMAELVKQTPICEGVVSRLNIVTGEIQYVSNKQVSPEEFAEAALGGFAITALVQDRNGWVDAGSRQMAPLKQCIDAGCDEIYVILGRPLDYTGCWQLPSGFLSALQMGYRALDLSLYELMLRDLSSCLKKNGDPGFKNIPIHVMSSKTLFCDSIEFRKCKAGVQYGLTEWQITEEKALRAALL